MTMQGKPKDIEILHGEIKTPPFSRLARIEAGRLLRLLQDGEPLSLPHSRPMPSIGKSCHELRINDEHTTWRIIYYIGTESIAILEIFSKKTQKTPKNVIDVCKKRLADFKLYE